ncbi:hypothetical protein BDN70DRAFT_931208 [Pholiota conissans]|uniref:Secreted protein n=1 Tax=Pholiota conissans TaxID=109636 RepID=A0A9P5Z6U2_9AGAR|nr:hypothetical protein BDN70DRAFT_931208 [Pholiota conissans]
MRDPPIHAPSRPVTPPQASLLVSSLLLGRLLRLASSENGQGNVLRVIQNADSDDGLKEVGLALCKHLHPCFYVPRRYPRSV